MIYYFYLPISYKRVIIILSILRSELMVEILKDASKIDTSSMTTEELINLRNAYQQVVDTINSYYSFTKNL